MAKILKVRLSQIARNQAKNDLAKSFTKSKCSRLSGRLSGLPIYTASSSAEEIQQFVSGKQPVCARVGWRYIATFDGDGSGSVEAATIDYAKKSKGMHRLWRIDHSADRFVEALRNAGRHSINLPGALRYTPRCLLFPMFRWSAVWMAERSPANDFFVIEGEDIATWEECREELSRIFEDSRRA